MIRKDFIDRLLSRIDLASLIGEYVDLRRSGATLEGCCPFHEEKTPSFKVFPNDSEEPHYHCFGCGAHGGPVEFLMGRNGMSFPDVIRTLAQREGMQIEYEERQESEQDKERRDEEAQIRQRILSTLRKAAGDYHKRIFTPEGEAARQELDKRGVGSEIILQYSLGFAPDAWDTLSENWAYGKAALVESGLAARRSSNNGCYDMFRNRIMFPIFDRRGQVVAFGGRTMGEGESAGPKYLNSPATACYRKGTELFGLYQAKETIRKEECVIVAEGYFDVVTPAQHGIGNVVSTCGTALTEKQRDILLQLSKKIIFCFDGDAAGEKATLRAAELLLTSVTDAHEIRLCGLPAGHDPDSFVREAGPEAFRQALQDAPTLSQYLVRRLTNRMRLTDPEGKTAIVVQAIRYWKQMNAPVLATFFRQFVCQAVGIREEEFDDLITAAMWRGTDAGAQLLPCPFCKGDAQMITDESRFAVRCRHCKSRSAPVEARDKAISNWNTRS